VTGMESDVDSSSRVETSVPAESTTPGLTPSASFRRIAVCVDGSDVGDVVVLHAATIAAGLAAPLTIVRVLEPDSSLDATPPDPLDWDVRQREARASLTRLVSLAARRHADVQSALIQGRAAEQICGWTLHHGADLTALASHGEHGRGEWRLSSTARKLVDAAPGSLLLIPVNGDRDDASAVGYRRIMVPLDGSARAESVLPMAMRLATAHAAEQLIAHVTPALELTRVGPLTAGDLELEQRVSARNERVARAYLDQIRARLSEAGITVRTVISRDGDARTRLARLVRREGVDLLILSAYGRRGSRDVPYGSVAAHLLTHVAAPLLVLRERPRRVLRRLAQHAARRADARAPTQAAP
jgi:nucleotide-binding universal stress UspA family protein